MKRNIVIAMVVVVAMFLWRVHVHHIQHLASTPPEVGAKPFSVPRVASSEAHVASLAGTVRDDTGAKIAGARVCASASSVALPGDLTRDPYCTTTAANGTYTLANLYAAIYQVSAMAPHYTLETYQPNGAEQVVQFPLAANEERRRVDIVLHHGGVEVAGTVSDAGGGVIARARVRIEGSTERYNSAVALVETDDHGHYAAWTRPGRITLATSADGYASQVRTGNAPATLDITLVPESILAGTVVDAVTGAPVAGVTVGATAVDNSVWVDTTQTDDHGRFTLSRLPPGRYNAIANAPHGTGFADGSTRLGLGQRVDGVVVRLHPAYQIVGRVIADAKPCASPALILVDEHQAFYPNVTVEADGTLHADGVLPGTYVATPACEGYTPKARYDPVVVTDRDVTASWTMDPGSVLTGRVRTTSGEPLVNVDVGVWSVATAQRVPQAYGGDRATHDGTYTIRGLRPGRYAINVCRSDMNAASNSPTPTEQTIEVTGAITRHDVVVPEASGTIVGQVTTSHGPLGKLYVHALDKGNDAASVDTDDAGHYVIRAVVPGTYEMMVRSNADHGRMEDLTEKPAQTVTVHAGETVTANLAIDRPSGQLRGRVVDGHGAPVPDAFVGLAFEQDDAPAIRSARSDSDEILVGSDGRFTAEHLSAGKYTVHASRKGGGEAVVAHAELGSDVTVKLEDTGEITGVAHRAGAAIDDLHVAIYDRDTDDRLRDELFFRTGGTFALHELPAGHYKLVILTGGSEHVSSVDLAAGGHETLDVELEGNVTLVGRAIDARTHQPVAGIAVAATLVSPSSAFATPADLRNTSGADGRFEIPNVPRGTLQIWGNTLTDGTQSSEPAKLERTVTASDPDVIEVGDVLVVTTTEAARGYPGMFVTLDGDPRSAKVYSVEPNGPAATAGIEAGDIITEVDGTDVTGDAADAAATLVTGEIGTAITVTLQRGVTVTIVLAKS